jgi:hypothetical protein
MKKNVKIGPVYNYIRKESLWKCPISDTAYTTA